MKSFRYENYDKYPGFQRLLFDLRHQKTKRRRVLAFISRTDRLLKVLSECGMEPKHKLYYLDTVLEKFRFELKSLAISDDDLRWLWCYIKARGREYRRLYMGELRVKKLSDAGELCMGECIYWESSRDDGLQDT